MDALKRIRRERPQTRVLVLTMHDDPAYARASVAAGAAVSYRMHPGPWPGRST